VRSRETRLPAGLEYAFARAAAADQLLIAFDFDGTLSPIVSNYEHEAANPEAVETLFALAALPRTRVAVISGRARQDLERRLGDCPQDVLLIGSHGAELEARAGGLDEDAGARAAVERFSEQLTPVAQRFQGSRLERKPFSIAYHYRNVGEERQQEAREAAIEAAGPSAVAVKDGKKVVEFFAVQADKGTALRQLRTLTGGDGEGRVTMLFVGDDVTDEAGFESLEEGDVGVKIGPGPTAAGFAMDGQEQVTPMLRQLFRLRSRETAETMP
jgi:trehalose 6-phosphate phosphatase